VSKSGNVNLPNIKSKLKEFACCYRKTLREKHDLESENNTGQANVRRESFSNTSKFPEDAEKTSFMLVKKTGEEGADISACADGEQD